MGAALNTTPVSVSVVVAAEAIAEPLAELVGKMPVPESDYAQQQRRSIECGKSRPFHMLLALGLEYADRLEVPLGTILEPHRQLIAAIEERRRIRLESVTGRTHQVAGPSLLRDIQREDRFEHAENQAALAVVADEDDPDRIEEMLARSAEEMHEQLRRDAALRARLARLRMMAVAS